MQNLYSRYLSRQYIMIVLRRCDLSGEFCFLVIMQYLDQRLGNDINHCPRRVKGIGKCLNLLRCTY